MNQVKIWKILTFILPVTFSLHAQTSKIPDSAKQENVLLDIDKMMYRLPKSVIGWLGDDKIGVYKNRAQVFYYADHLEVRVPVSKTNNAFLCGFKYYNQPDEIRVYAVELIPKSNTGLGYVELWMDMQHLQIYGREMLGDSALSYYPARHLADSGWEQCALKAQWIRVNDTGGLVIAPNGGLTGATKTACSRKLPKNFYDFWYGLHLFFNELFEGKTDWIWMNLHNNYALRKDGKWLPGKVFLNRHESIHQNGFYTRKKDPLQYKYTGKESLAFEENFNDNHNNWMSIPDTDKVDTTLCRFRFNEGVLIIENRDTADFKTIGIYKDIDYNRDYEIEVGFQIDTCKDHNTNAAYFGWGGDTSEHNGGTVIMANHDGYYFVKDCHGGDHRDCTYKQFDAFINKKNYNVFTLRKTGNTYYLFINDVFEKKIPAKALKGNRIYLSALPQSTISYDYIRVYYLDDGT